MKSNNMIAERAVYSDLRVLRVSPSACCVWLG